MKAGVMLKLKLIICVVMLLATANASAQTAATQTPDAVARQVVEAMRVQDWAQYAGLMHKEALANLKRAYGLLLSAKDAAEARRQLFDANTPTEYERLSEQEVFVRLMRGVTKQVPRMNEMYASSEMTVLGSVAETPELSHVVYRFKATLQGVPITKMAIISFKRERAEWRALLLGDLEAIVTAALKSAGK